MGPLAPRKPKDQQRFGVEGFICLFFCFVFQFWFAFYTKEATQGLIRAVTTECLSKDSAKGSLMPGHVFHHPTLCLLPLKSTPPGEQGKPVFLSCIVFLRREEDFTVQYLTREHNRKWTEGKRTFINCFQARIFIIFFALDRSNLPASLRVVFCITSHSCPTFSWWLSAFHIGILTSWWLLSSEGQTRSV